MIKPFHSEVFSQEKLKRYVHIQTWTQMFIVALLIIAKEWENANVH